MKVGNFELGDCFCDVKCSWGHKIRHFNINRGHYAACDKCKSFIKLGENLKSDWRNENKAIWEANFRSVKSYRFIA